MNPNLTTDLIKTGVIDPSDVIALETADGDGAREKAEILNRMLNAVHGRATSAAILESALGHCQWLSARNERLCGERAGHALAALYRIGVATGGFSLAYALGSAWPLLASIPLLFLSPKTKN